MQIREASGDFARIPAYEDVPFGLTSHETAAENRRIALQGPVEKFTDERAYLCYNAISKDDPVLHLSCKPLSIYITIFTF